MHEDDQAGQEFWDSRYSESEQMWSGKPNDALVREVTGMTPGRALDLGSGEGADAIWLAQQGWRVTGTDISGVALDRAAGHARDADVDALIEWRRHDLGESFPEGEWDLVSAQFLHTPGEMPREKILRAAAAAVAPGGVLLIVGHASGPSWDHEHHDMHFPTTDEVLLSLELPEGQWEVLRSEEHERVQTGPDGQPGHRTDNTLKLRRLR
ncbi:class I SAM-dependent methyltransferase [Actinomadura sp. 9N407]|uniref:class I SAM-dependent methyltransferase n=1 Tax=Actinomadura sp. 9N407 TaxID=3375154 RepID=UPI0037B51D5B